MNLGPYADFIVTAYALAAFVIIDHAAQRRMIANLEARGISRRSERTAREPA